MPSHTDAKDATVLLVDDETQTLKYFERAFSDDFAILTAQSVDQAEALLQQHGDRIGVVITDQRMPGRTGVDLLAILRQKQPHVIRILTTAYAELENAIDAVNTGEIFRYIVKPWDFEQLRQELRLALLVYSLQRDREHLLREKLSVRQRSRAAHRARDVLVFSNGFAGLRNAAISARSFIEDAAPRSSSTAGDGGNASELWGEEEAETAALGNLARHLSSEVAKFEPADWNRKFPPVSFTDVLTTELARAGARLEVAGKSELQAPADRLVAFARALVAASGEIVSAKVGSNSKAITAELNARIVPGAGDGLLYAPPAGGLPPDLLLAYLLAGDLGGSLRVAEDGPSSIRLEANLPIDASAASDAKLPASWTEGAFSAFERWSA